MESAPEKKRHFGWDPDAHEDRWRTGGGGLLRIISVSCSKRLEAMTLIEKLPWRFGDREHSLAPGRARRRRPRGSGATGWSCFHVIRRLAVVRLDARPGAGCGAG